MKKAKSKKPAYMQDYREHVANLPLQEAMWWFIENAHDELPYRTDIFFALRQRVRLQDEFPEAPRPSPRVLIIVEGGIADYVADEGVEVAIFDRDDHECADEDDDDYGVDILFADLAGPVNVHVKREAVPG